MVKPPRQGMQPLAARRTPMRPAPGQSAPPGKRRAACRFCRPRSAAAMARAAFWIHAAHLSDETAPPMHPRFSPGGRFQQCAGGLFPAWVGGAAPPRTLVEKLWWISGLVCCAMPHAERLYCGWGVARGCRRTVEEQARTPLLVQAAALHRLRDLRHGEPVGVAQRCKLVYAHAAADAVALYGLERRGVDARLLRHVLEA